MIRTSIFMGAEGGWFYVKKLKNGELKLVIHKDKTTTSLPLVAIDQLLKLHEEVTKL